MNSDSPRAMPIRTWLAEKLKPDVAAAIDRIAATEDVQRVVVLPDVHLATNVCVGTVIATASRIYPQAVGGDIGCGITAIAFDGGVDALNEGTAARLLNELRRVIPIHRHGSQRTASAMPETIEATALSQPMLETIRRREGRVQFATLGRGNHFLEFQADEEGRLWLAVHSGFAAIGQAICDFHLSRAAISNTGLAFLDANTPEGMAYLADAAWARKYAAASRKAMAFAASALAGEILGVAPRPDVMIECDHNHVQLEEHEGDRWWVHRKGAMCAGEGEAGVLPGSMGTATYHVEGRGCAESLRSSSHGAGRALSRDAARRTLNVRQIMRQMEGVWFDRGFAHELREESPGAYKDIRAVLRAQKELIRVTRRLRPLLCFKGV